MYDDPNVDDFKAYFIRDFPYTPDPEEDDDLNYVINSDIYKALNDAKRVVNTSLFTSQDDYTAGFLTMAAHWLVMNLRASSQGIQGKFPWLQQSKSVGSVAESFGIPQRILDNPEFAMLCQTNYGAKYLFMVLPLMSGQMFTVCGRTAP